MLKLTRVYYGITLFLGLAASPALAQETDTLKKYQEPAVATTAKEPFLKSKAFRATIVPALLIGYGVSTIGDRGIYSSHEVRRDILSNYPKFDTWLDDPLLVAPYVELAVANLFNVKSSHDFLNTTILILKAEAIFGVAVYGLKNTTRIERPNGENRESMPSGHTAQAFLAASILHTELRYKSNWYGVGAYTIATSVGAFRMLKNKHWQSDVFVGAGIGILSSHLAYLSHRNRWGRKPFSVVPTYLFGTPALHVAIDLNKIKPKRSTALSWPAPTAGTLFNDN
jgi:membrane-associated phospholipid phosphatase